MFRKSIVFVNRLVTGIYRVHYPLISIRGSDWGMRCGRIKTEDGTPGTAFPTTDIIMF